MSVGVGASAQKDERVSLFVTFTFGSVFGFSVAGTVATGTVVSTFLFPASGHGLNSQLGPVRPTYEPSGHNLASSVHAIGIGCCWPQLAKRINEIVAITPAEMIFFIG